MAKEAQSGPSDAHGLAINQRYELLPGKRLPEFDSPQAEAFEVTPAGEYVWRFLNPTLNEAGERSTMNRTERHDIDFIEGLIKLHARRE